MIFKEKTVRNLTVFFDFGKKIKYNYLQNKILIVSLDKISTNYESIKNNL
jgi:hypothetical protein